MSWRMNAGTCLAWIVSVFGTSGFVWGFQDSSGGGESKLTIVERTSNDATTPNFLDHYETVLEELRASILDSLPVVEPQKKLSYLSAREVEKAAVLRLEMARAKLGEIDTARALVGHAKGKWIGGADKGIAAAESLLENAKTEAERQTAQKELEKWKQNREEGVAALKERQAKLDQVELKKSTFDEELNAAQLTLVNAKAATLIAVKELGLDPLLTSDELDFRLAKLIVLSEATPSGLAEFAQIGASQESQIEDLLADEKLMLQMVVADGAEEGKYGRAMEIYSTIQETSPHADDGVLQRLALAISLEHAVPVSQRNAEGLVDSPMFIDPVKRYRHFEEAFQEGALDPGFKNLTTWDLRMVVNGNEPDAILAWGREMLNNYRPDHVHTSDYRWRYVAAVRTDIKYGSQDNKFDKPELQFFQNILMNGGVCGRRAFFGRFMLRSFGVPTTARPQRGHAALAHWTPDGWVVCLGGGWGAGWASGPNNWPDQQKKGRESDLDFLATTQARSTGKKFMQIKRAQWIGDVVGEKRSPGFHTSEPEFWYALSFYRQRDLIESAKSVTLAPVGEELGEANVSRVKYAMESATITEEDREIRVDGDGAITIPAVACSKPTQSTGKIVFMPSNLGGKQMHYSRIGKPEDFEYTFDAPRTGKYALSAQVVTPSWKQRMSVTVNDTAKPIEIELPFTVGRWERTEPVEVDLVQGKNVLRFSRQEPVKGTTIKDFTLKPMN